MNLMRAAFRASQPSLSRVQSLFQPNDTAVLLDPAASALYADAVGTTPAVVGGPVGLRLDVARGVMALNTANPLPTDDFSGGRWAALTGGSISGTTLVATNATGTFGIISLPSTLPAGLWQFTYTISSIASGEPSSRFAAANGPCRTAPGTYTEIRNFSSASSVAFGAQGSPVPVNCVLSAFSARLILGNHASQGTTALCPILRVTDITNRKWLEAPDADDALNLTFASAPGECDVGVLNGDGSFTWSRPTLGTTVNVVTRFALNAFWVMRKRAFEPPERALIERYAKRYAPAPGEWT